MTKRIPGTERIGLCSRVWISSPPVVLSSAQVSPDSQNVIPAPPPHISDRCAVSGNQ